MKPAANPTSPLIGHFPQFPRLLSLVVMLAILLVFLAGCKPVVGSGQTNVSQQSLILSTAIPFGQTLTAKHAGLSAIWLYLEPIEMGQGTVHLQVYKNPANSTALREALIQYETVTSPGWYRFPFEPIPSSNLSDFFVSVSLEENGVLGLGYAQGNTYQDGSAYQSGKPLPDAQLAFQLEYSPTFLAWGIVLQSIEWLRILLVGILLFIVPGWVLWDLLWSGWSRIHWLDQLGLAGGTGIAIYPILFVWTNLIGLHLGPAYAWIPVVLGGCYLLWKVIRSRHTILYQVRSSIKQGLAPSWKNQNIQHVIALSLVVLMIIVIRFYIVRTLPLPLWGDSLQHTIITQLLVDNGGLFDSWQPYAELNSFTYHFGFHAASAVFHWVSGLDAPQAVLYTGQLFNILAVVGLYSLTNRLARNRWAGIVAVIVAGLLSQMPMFYVNWGRYTQLAGQVIIIPAVYALIEISETRDRNQRILPGIILAGILWGGLGLTHYRVLIMAIFFVPVLFLIRLIQTRRLQFLTPIAMAGGLGGLLFLPWFIKTIPGTIVTQFTRILSTPANQVSDWTLEYNSIGNLTTYMPGYLWILAGVLLGISLLRRRSAAALIGFWFLLVVFSANPRWLRLPGDGVISNFTVFIAAYLFAAVLIGIGVGELLHAARQWKIPAMGLALVTGLIIISSLGARQRLKDIQANVHSLATRPDIRAISWITQNTDPNDAFIINGMLAYGGSLVVGTDGGWWLSYLTGQKSSIPPLTYSMEKSPIPEYRKLVNDTTGMIFENGLKDSNTIQDLKARGYHYIYIGQLHGSSNNPGKKLIPLEELEDNPFVELSYHQDRVWIYKIR